MKNISESQYDQLCDACDSLLKKKPFSFERISNFSLHVVREHPIFLKNYNAIFHKGGMAFFIYLIKEFFYNLLLGSYKFLCAIYRNYFLGDKLLKDKRDFENIFISHFLDESFIEHVSDFYFFDLPKKISSKNALSLKLLINFTNKSSLGASKKLENKPIISKLLPKYLPLLDELKIRVFLGLEALSLMKTNATSKLEKRLKYLAAISSLSSSTHANYRLAILVQKYVMNNNVKRVFTTYEGHPWERLIFGMARKIDKSVICIGYQHALVFRKQHSIRRKLEESFEPDFILFSGERGLKSFKAINYLNPKRLILFGTNRVKSDNYIPKKIKLKDRNVFLVLPEGDLIECIPLTRFLLKLATIYTDFKFIIRFHPITDLNQIIKRCPKLEGKLPNVELSKMPFDYDLKRSNFAIYRGSTTIIKAIQNGLIPLYYKKQNEISIDPLFEVQKEKIDLTTPKDLEFILRKSLPEIEKSQAKLINHVNDFFNPLDYNEVLKNLKK